VRSGPLFSGLSGLLTRAPEIQYYIAVAARWLAPEAKMTTPFAVDAPRLQPKMMNGTPHARDISINDYAWAASPRIFQNYVLSQTTPCLRGASNSNVCRTAEARS
jgi:hypothetical protein